MLDRLSLGSKIAMTIVDDVPMGFLAITLWVASGATNTMVQWPETMSFVGVLQALSKDIFGYSAVGTTVAATFITLRLGLNLYATYLQVRDKRQEVRSKRIDNDEKEKQLERDN